MPWYAYFILPPGLETFLTVDLETLEFFGYYQGPLVYWSHGERLPGQLRPQHFVLMTGQATCTLVARARAQARAVCLPSRGSSFNQCFFYFTGG